MSLAELIGDLSEDGIMDVDSFEAAIELVKVEKLRERLGNNKFKLGKLNRVLDASKNLPEQEEIAYSSLASLTKRERQCFLMNSIESKSFGKIANELGISKGSVQQYIERARRKIKQAT